MKSSIYDLSMDIFNLLGKSLTREDKNEIFSQVRLSFIDGWVSGEIFKVLKSNKDKIISNGKVNVSSILKNNSNFNSKSNLIDPRKMYFHSELRITPGGPKLDFDYNTGELIRITPEYFLELRDSYTIDNIIDYFISKKDLYNPNAIVSRKRIEGSVKWLLSKYELEEILYMIDAANDTISYNDLMKLKGIIDIQDYYSSAKEVITLKITEAKRNGDDKIVPRNRK